MLARGMNTRPPDDPVVVAVMAPKRRRITAKGGILEIRF